MALENLLIAITFICIFLQVYHFVLYPALISVAARFASKPESTPSDVQLVSLVISAFNERGIIEEKLANSAALSPLPCEIIVVADGSDDGTERVAEEFSTNKLPVRVIFDPVRRGKAAAMQRGFAASSGDVLLFSDANAMYSVDTIGAVIRAFDRERVAVVSGVKHVFAPRERDGDGVAASDGLYWQLERTIRLNETRLGCTVAVVGELLAIRRRDWTGIPDGIVNDDSWLAMSAIARGRDVVCAPEAESWEASSTTGVDEIVRRRRINAGRLKLVFRREIWPLSRPWPLLAFVSHKVMRLFLPILFVFGLVGSAALALWVGSSIFCALAALHFAFLLLGSVGLFGRGSLKSWIGSQISAHILRSYWAAFLAFWDIMKGRDFVLWEKIAR